MTTEEVADKIVANCKSGNFMDNYENYYAEDVASYEPQNNHLGVERETKGLKTVLERANQFHDKIEKVLSKMVSEPLVAGEYFTFRLSQEFQLKGIGYVKLEELCMFRVQNGKVVREEYFY